MKILLFTIIYGYTILSAQLFINEIDYDQAGTDHDEFIEIAGPAGTYSNVIIELINGSTNSVYETVQISSLTLSNQSDGYGFHVEYIPGIQNSTEGVQLRVGDVIVDAVAYEGSMNDADGNAMEEAGEDYQVSDGSDGEQSLSRLGLDGTPWQELAITPGTINTNQTMSNDIDIQGCTDSDAYNYNPDATVDDGTCLYYEVVTMAVARASGVDIPVIVQGVVTSPCFHADHADYTFQDATAGIVLFGYNLSDLGLNVGDEIKVSGITDEYNGKFEIVISSADDVEIISTGNSVTPQVITVDDLYTNGETYESELITILNVSVIDGDWPTEGSDSNLEITDNGVSKTTMRIDEDTEIDGTTEPNWPLDVTGVGGQWIDDYQILPRFTTDFQGEPGMPVANAGPDQVVEPGDFVTLNGSASSDENGDIVAYEWTQIGGSQVDLSCEECENGISTFYAPTFDDELIFRLTVWDNEFNDGVDNITITVSDPITIHEIQYTEFQGTDPDCYSSLLFEEEITTSGIVTAVKPGTYPNFYLTQPGVTQWGGIYVYDTSVNPQPGDKITLTATVGEYGGGTQLTDVSTFTTISNNNPFNPILLSSLADLGGYECNLSGESYESMLIKVNNVTVTEVDEYGQWVITDNSGALALVDDYIYDGEGEGLPDDPPSGSFSITGIINSYYDYKIV